jgi:hypothetical protein
MPNKKSDNIFDLGSMMDIDDKDLGDNAGKEIGSGVEEAEGELENLSFVKGTGKKDRNPDDPFAQLGL